MKFESKGITSIKGITGIKGKIKKLVILVVLVVPVILFPAPAGAATGINRQINFQGKLVDANGLNVANATYTVVFSLYSVSSGGTAIWTETQNVTTANGDGIFQVQLGSVTSLPGSVDFNTDNIYLGIKVNSDAEMTPRVRFTAVPYAFNAEKVGGMTVTNTTGTFTLAAAKTLTVSNTLTLAGTDGKTLTLNGNTTLADNAITFGGTQTLTLAATKSVVFADAFSTVGAFATTLTSTGVTNVTLPTTGTLLTNTASANQTITSTQTSGTVFAITDATNITAATKGQVITLSGTGAFDQTGLEFNLSGATGTNLNDIVGTGSTWKVSRAGALTVASCSGCGAGSSSWSGITDPSTNLTLGHGTNTTTFNSTATTQNFFTMNADSLTTGKVLTLSSTSGAITSGELLYANHTATYATATVTGSVVDVNRSITGTILNNVTITGALAKFTDLCAHGLGACTSSNNVVEIAQNFTANTGTALNVSHAGTGLGLSVSGTATGTLNSARLVNTVAAAANSGSQLLFTANRTTSGLTNIAGVSGIITDITDGAYKGAVVFSTANNAAPAERVRIDNTGKVGIGITNPNSKLHVGPGSAQLETTASAITYATRENVLQFSRADLPTSWFNKISSSISSTATDNTINFELATGASTNITVMTLNSAGSVGIGISNPTAQLEVASAATTGNAQLVTVNSLTSGKGLSVASTATGFTGSLIEASLTGDNAANTGALLKSLISGTSSAAVGAMLTNLGTGLSLRINDETGDADTTPFVVDAAGYLGVGLSAPTRQAHIYGVGQAVSAITDAGNKGGTLYIQDSVGGVDNGGAVIFGASQGFFAGIKSLIQNGLGGTAGDLAFLTRNSTSDTALTERIRILSTGQVGIGISNPTATLELASTATTTNAQTITSNSLTSGKGLSINSSATALTGILTDISLTGNNAANTGTLLRVTNGANASNANTLALFTNGGTGTSFRVNDDGTDTDTTPFLIDASGSIGVGIVSPNSKIHVAGGAFQSGTTSSAQNYATRENVFMSNRGDLPTSWLNKISSSLTGTGTNSETTLNFELATGASSNVNVMTLNAAGNVGIGITLPSTSLHVQGAGLAENTLIAQAIISSTAAYNANPVAGINFYNKYSSGGAYAGMGGIGVGKLNTTDGDYSSFLGLYTRTHGGSVTERIRIDNAGSVGIGNTNPNTVLDVTGFITSRSLNTANGAVYTDSTGKLLTTATGGAGNLCLVSASGAAPSFTSCPAGSALWSAISAPTGDLTLAHSTHATTFNSTATTQNFFTMNADSLTTGRLLTLGSTSGALTSGEILNANHTATYGTVTVTGSVLNVNRSITGVILNTVTVSGSVAKFTDNCNHGLGVCSSSANVVDITQSFASNTGTALNISHLGTGIGLNVSGTATGTLNAVRIQNTVAAANNSGAQLLFNANRTTSGATNIAGVAGIITDITDGAYKGALVFSTANNASPAERMRIDNSGNVGIGITSSLAGNLDIRQLANGNDVFYSRRNTDSSPTGNFIRLSNTAGTTDLFKVEINGDVKLGNTTSTIGLTATDNTAVFNIVDSAGTPNKLLQLKDLNTNFGSLLLVGAVEGRNSYFEEDYNSFRGTAATADCIQGRGSYGNPGTAACTAGSGELTLDVTLGTSATANVSSLADTANGIERITATSSTLGTAVAMEYLGSAAINNAQANWLAANLPVYSAKIRTVVTPASTERYYYGLSDMQTPAAGTPTNGIFFTNCSTAGGSPSCDGTIRGMVVSGGSIVGSVQACSAPGTTNFGYYRFEVRSTGAGTGEVHFYHDADVSNGIVETECGSGITGVTLPSAAMSVMLKVDATSVLGGAATLDVDYFRVWQDDAPNSAVATEETKSEEKVATSETAESTESTTSLTDMIGDLSRRIFDLETKTASIEADLTLYSAPLAQDASSSAELNLDMIEATDATLSGTLNVAGRTVLADIGITGQINAGLLNINGLDSDGFASINTTTGPLKLQSDGFNGIDILNGKIVIDTKGNMKVSGSITVKKLNIDTEDVAGASVGTAVIPLGSTSIDVNTEALTDKSKIFVTAEEPVAIGAKAKDSDSITIKLTTPHTSDLKVNWWIVN